MGSCGTFAAFFLAMPAGLKALAFAIATESPDLPPIEIVWDISELYADAQKISEISKQLLHAQ